MKEYTKKQELLNCAKIDIPDNATLGDVIEAILPNAEVGPDPYKPSVDIYIGGILMMRVDRNLWNASYRAVSEGK